MASIGPSMRWAGSGDPDVKSGIATFIYAADDQEISISLPDFSTAHLLHAFILSIYEGGKIAGGRAVEIAVDNALKQLVR